MMVADEHMIARLLIASLCGGLVGLERELYGRAAGLRTHILVTVGSCLIMLVSIYIFEAYRSVATCDPSRIAAGVVTGIGFLGAGTILRGGDSIKGLTTAASIWVMSGVGLAVGAGFYKAAFTTTIIVLVTLFLLSKLEHEIIERRGKIR